MPWRLKAMKDVVSCDKLGEVQTTFDPGISEWGNPPELIPVYSPTEYIGA